MRTLGNLLAHLSILIFLFCDTDAAGFTVDQFKHAKLIQKDDLPGFKQSETIKVLYYFHVDNPRHRGFYYEYDKSAEYLGLYNIKLGVVNCQDPLNSDVDRCTQDGTPGFVYTYNHGNELLALEIETMFDVNSIMSNILQLALLRDVPILQTDTERENFVNQHKGKDDIIFSFQKAIGTYEHRIFMEVAYAFHHKFKFAISTSTKAVTGLLPSPETLEDAKVWFLMCSQVNHKGDDCFVKLYDEKMDLSSLANFMRRLDSPPNFDIPGNGTTHPYTPDLDLHVVYLFYRESTRDTVQEMVRVIGRQFHGTAGFVTVNLGITQGETIGLDEIPDSTPTIAVQLRSEEKPVYMTEAWSLDGAFEFFARKLHEYDVTYRDDEKQSSSEISRAADDDEDNGKPPEKDRYDEDIETEDDQVAEAIQRARRIKLDVELVKKLTDKTFNTTIKDKNIVFILFYLPFDHRSLAFLRSYGEAARKFENQTDRPYTSVNCHDWTDVCAQEKIIQYPVLRIYRQGRLLKDYDGVLSTEGVVSSYKLLKQEKPVYLPNPEDIEKFFSGVLPDGSNVTGSVSVIALFADQKKEMQVYRDLAESLGDRFVFGMNSDGKGKDVAKKYDCVDLPCVVLLRKYDLMQPFVTFKGDSSSAEELTKFIENSLIPSLAELTPSIFPRLYKQNRPFVISFVDNSDTSREMMEPIQSLVRGGGFPDLIFCSLQSGEMNSFGRQILQTYHNSTSSSLPALSYAHLKEGKVYNYLDKDFTKDQIEGWLRDIQTQIIDNKTLFLLKQGIFKPRIKGYHFLDFIKEDEELKKKRKRPNSVDPDVITANVHGIGFDSEGNEVVNTGDIMKKEETVDDSEIRRELIDLQKSRLYHHAEGKHKPPQRKPDDLESSPVDISSDSPNVSPPPEEPAPHSTTSTSDEPTPSSTKQKIIHEDL